MNAAEELGKALVLKGIGLVYGGGNSGMMGKISSAVMSNGGEAIGVFPKTLHERKFAGPELSEIHMLMGLLDHIECEGFLGPNHIHTIYIDENPYELAADIVRHRARA